MMPDLEELYREIILDHYRSPRNRGELPSPPAHRVEGFNPLCGDEVVVTVVLDHDDVSDIKINGIGCSISQSSASLMSAAVKGKTLDEVRGLIRTFKSMMSIHESVLEASSDEIDVPASRVGGGVAEPARTEAGDEQEEDAAEPEPVDLSALGELAALQGVVKFPVRIKCATLSWNALAQALDELSPAAR
jgi:nitrogen fixation protein NifU and related proteins